MKPGKFWITQALSLCIFSQMVIWMHRDIPQIVLMAAMMINSTFFVLADLSPTRTQKIIGATIGCILLILSIPLSWGRPVVFAPIFAIIGLLVHLTLLLRRKIIAETPLHI